MERTRARANKYKWYVKPFQDKVVPWLEACVEQTWKSLWACRTRQPRVARRRFFPAGMSAGALRGRGRLGFPEIAACNEETPSDHEALRP